MFPGYRHDSASLALNDYSEEDEHHRPKLHRELFNQPMKGHFWDVQDAATAQEFSGLGGFAGPLAGHDMPTHKYATRARSARSSSTHFSWRSSGDVFHEDASILAAQADSAAEQAEAAVMKASRSLKRVAAEMQAPAPQTMDPGSPEEEETVRYHTRSCEHQPRKVQKHNVDIGPQLGRTSAKGLRHFSMKVCEKVESKGRTTYNEVADELVQDLSQADEGDDQYPQYDEKNIRRRVYDALNVLMAMDIIGREKKEIIWKGLPSFAGNSTEKLKTEKLQRAAELERKQAHLQDLLDQHRALKRLLSRNSTRAPTSSGTLLHLPFILVQTKPDATVEIQISEDQLDVKFDFYETPYRLHDDGFVLRHLAVRMSDDLAEPSPLSHGSVVKQEDMNIFGSPTPLTGMPLSAHAEARLAMSQGSRPNSHNFLGTPQLSSAGKAHMHAAHQARLGLDDMDPNSPAVVAIPHHMSAAAAMATGYLHNLYAAPGVYACES